MAAPPSLAPYSAYTRGRAIEVESRIARRRNQEDAMRQRWIEHSRYLHTRDVQSMKRAAWYAAPSQSPLSSERLQAQREEEEKKRKLEERRLKLRQLLHDEQLDYEKELKENTPDKLSRMKSRVDQLKSHRQEKSKQLAEEKRVEQWRANCPELRLVEARERQKAVHHSWKEQVDHRAEEKESARREKERHEQHMEEERQEALRLEKEQKRKQQSVKRENADALHRQMAEVKAREEEAARLEAEQTSIQQEQVKLEIAEERRLRLEEGQKKAELGMVLARQAKSQLRRKSQRIQEALELDLEILEDLAQREVLERELVTERRERATADAAWMKQVVSEQLRLEKEREAELDILYQEEAARMWESKEREWEKERQARERLMKEVLAERQEQLKEKMESLKLQQAESIEQREAVLRDMEALSVRTAREAHRKRDGQTRRADELQAQVEEQRRKAERLREQYERELAEQRRAEEEYETAVRSEEQRIVARAQQPKFHGRRKHAWY